jgi:hypothetical protein
MSNTSIWVKLVSALILLTRSRFVNVLAIWSAE